MFPARVRYSGVSIGYALGSIVGGAFAPLIAELLLQRTGQSWSIGVYIAVLAVISFAAVSMVPKSLQDSVSAAASTAVRGRRRPSPPNSSCR